MRILKFGGASVKDANGVKNLVRVLEHQGTSNKLIVLSAMGKMTNAFEKVVEAYLYDSQKLKSALKEIEKFHYSILNDLFQSHDEIFQKVAQLFKNVQGFFIENQSEDYNYVYDYIVSYGELLSTTIVSAFLEKRNIKNQWLDIRQVIKTDSNYRKAKVNWQETLLKSKSIDVSKLYITQGFISSDSKDNTTTLGREGSDYTAGILAYCLNAESVTIWKDVNGVLNADPRVFKNTKLLKEISYQEAIEMAFYGASVIHPKTIKPLENKRIPLYVRSFENLENKGTKVSKGVILDPKTSCYIVKKNQILVSISTNDFSFMVEENISTIFKQLHQNKLKVNLIQNSAISFSVCLEDGYNHFNKFYSALREKFKIKYNNNAVLYTIKHFDENAINQVVNKGIILLKQSSRETIQFVIDEKNNYDN